MLTKLYRQYVSPEIREKIYTIFLGQILYFFRNFSEIMKMKFYYWFHWILPNTGKNRCLAFMGKYGLMNLPYPFRLEFDKKVVDCQFDEEHGMFFVNHHENRLYFPKSYCRDYIIHSYQCLIAEQDSRSPHQYVENLNRLKGKTLLDIGAAEGIFSLDVVELVQKLYLFECNSEWIGALETTFAPWKNKVEIVQKYVSDVNDENNITIDKFLEGKEKTNLFIKMDIEGYEQVALRGASNTMKEAQDIDFSICTYHRENDAQEIAQLLQQYNLEYEQTEGYFYCTLQGNKGLRKAIIKRK